MLSTHPQHHTQPSTCSQPLISHIALYPKLSTCTTPSPMAQLLSHAMPSHIPPVMVPIREPQASIAPPCPAMHLPCTISYAPRWQVHSCSCTHHPGTTLCPTACPTPFVYHTQLHTHAHPSTQPLAPAALQGTGCRTRGLAQIL